MALGNFSSSLGTSSSLGQSQSTSGESWSPEQLARIKQLYPQILSRLGQVGSIAPFSQVLQQAGGTPLAIGPSPDFGSVGGAAAYPEITQKAVYTPDEIQAQVNQLRAQNTAELQGQQRQAIASAAGHGFMTGSPLTQALSTNLAGQAMASSTEAENNLRWQAASGNAQQLLAQQQAGVARARAMGGEDVQRRQLSAQDQLQRLQLQSEDQLRRQQLGVTQYGQLLSNQANRENSLLSALGYYNRPLQQARSSSTQQATSRQGSFTQPAYRSPQGSHLWSNEPFFG